MHRRAFLLPVALLGACRGQPLPPEQRPPVPGLEAPVVEAPATSDTRVDARCTAIVEAGWNAAVVGLGTLGVTLSDGTRTTYFAEAQTFHRACVELPDEVRSCLETSGTPDRALETCREEAEDHLGSIEAPLLRRIPGLDPLDPGPLLSEEEAGRRWTAVQGRWSATLPFDRSTVWDIEADGTVDVELREGSHVTHETQRLSFGHRYRATMTSEPWGAQDYAFFAFGDTMIMSGVLADRAFPIPDRDRFSIATREGYAAWRDGSCTTVDLYGYPTDGTCVFTNRSGRDAFVVRTMHDTQVREEVFDVVDEHLLTDALRAGAAVFTREGAHPRSEGPMDVVWETDLIGWANVEASPGAEILVVGGGHVGMFAGAGDLLWARELAHPSGHPLARPVRAGRVGLVPASDTLYALDLKTGQERWHAEAPRPSSSSWEAFGDVVAVVGQRVVTTRAAKRLLGLDLRTGEVAWTLERDASLSPPTVMGKQVLVVESELRGGATLLRIDPRGGKVVAETGFPGTGAVDVPGVVVDDGVVFCTKDTLLRLASDFTVAWQISLPQSFEAGCTPAVAGSRVFAVQRMVTEDDRVLAVDLVDGRIRWSRQTATLRNNTAYWVRGAILVPLDDALARFDATDGHTLDPLHAPWVTAVVDTPGGTLLADASGSLVMIRMTTPTREP